MANGFYKKALKKIWDGEITPLSSDMVLLLLTADHYTPDLDNDEFMDDIPAGGIVAISPVLSGKSTDGGVFDANNPTIPGVSGDDVDYVALAKSTGTPGTSPLVCLWDSSDNLPLIPDGSGVEAQFSDGSDKVCKI